MIIPPISPVPITPGQLAPLATVIAQSPSVEVNGPFLVMRVDATLPRRCVKCNRATQGRTIRKRLLWSDAETDHAGGRARLIPVFGKLFAFVSLFRWLRDLRTIRLPAVRVGVCARHALFARLLTILMLLGIPAALLLMWTGIRRADIAMFWGGFVLLAVAGFAGQRPRPVKAVHVGVGWVTIAGACRAYL